MSELIYLYGFVPDTLPAPDQLAGIEGAPVQIMPAAGLGAVISRVPEGDYSAAPIEQKLQDLTWVAERGLEHERVVAWCVDHGQIIPAALFTLYSSAAALQNATAARAPLIHAELERLRDVREWDLKVAYDGIVLTKSALRFSDALRQVEAEMAAAPPGRKYLLKKKQADLTKGEVSRIAQEQGQRVLARVLPLSAESAILPIPQSREQLPVVLHAALLVARAQERQLVDTLRQINSEYDDSGITVSFSGPWAPYRFVRHE